MEMLNIQMANKSDLDSLLQLYTHLHGNPFPKVDCNLLALWDNILSDINHNVIVGKIENKIVSSCVLVIIPNLTHQQRPYALIENVVTHEEYRGKGYATQVLNFARDIAKEQNCYKIMLLTGSKMQSTLDFYKRAGYNENDKTAFIQWL